MKRFVSKFSLPPFCFTALANAYAAERTLDIYCNDVEGGAATLIVMPAGESFSLIPAIPADATQRAFIKPPRRSPGRRAHPDAAWR